MMVSFPLECTSAGRTDGQTRIFSCAITRRFMAGGFNSRRFNEGGAIVVMFTSSWVKGHRHASVRPQVQRRPRVHSFAFRVPYIYACSFLRYSFNDVYSLSSSCTSIYRLISHAYGFIVYEIIYANT